MFKKKLSILLVVALFITILGGCSKSGSKALKDKKVLNIGIMQIVEHPALDLARKGFVETLAKNGFKDGEVVL